MLNGGHMNSQATKSESSANTSIDLGNGFGAVCVDEPSKHTKRKPSPSKVRANECKGSRVALNGYPMTTPCPHCGRVFDAINFLARGSNDVAFPPHKTNHETLRKERVSEPDAAR